MGDKVSHYNVTSLTSSIIKWLQVSWWRPSPPITPLTTGWARTPGWDPHLRWPLITWSLQWATTQNTPTSIRWGVDQYCACLPLYCHPACCVRCRYPCTSTAHLRSLTWCRLLQGRTTPSTCLSSQSWSMLPPSILKPPFLRTQPPIMIQIWTLV